MKRIYRGVLLLAFAWSARGQFFMTDTTIGPGDTNYDGQDIVALGCTLTVDGSHVFSDVLLAEGAVLTHSGGTNGVGPANSSGVDLTVENNLVIDGTSAIRADGLDQLGAGKGARINANFPGGPDFLSGSGGGHGGYGASSLGGALGGACYGRATTISNYEMGSAGGAGSGSGGLGGGLIRLSVGGAILLDGVISANGGNGTNSGAGGGSGGGIELSAGSILGAGSIFAQGGAGDPLAGGGGGGGRIVIGCKTNGLAGAISAPGGPGYLNGGAGTVYLTESNATPMLVVDNGGLNGTNTPVMELNNVFVSFSLLRGARVTMTGGLELSALVVGSNSVLSVGIGEGTAEELSIAVGPGAVTVEAGGVILLDGDGGVRGPGAGGSIDVDNRMTGGGGGYGGYGGASAFGAWGGPSEGGSAEPIVFNGSSQPVFGGSGGAGLDEGIGGAQGGDLALMVRGTLLLNGRVSANGNPGVAEGSGGGAGGGIAIQAGVFGGSGVISVNGGAGQLPYGGGGAGGRVVINCASNVFTGSLTAYGGAGANYGGAGTIFLETTVGQESAIVPQLIVANDGTRGTNTPLQGLPELCDLTLAGGAVGVISGEATVQNLFIGSNSIAVDLTPAPWTVNGNATIAAGGEMVANGLNNQEQGQGTGRRNEEGVGGGGGHGGFGGSGAGGLDGGQTYDNFFSPEEQGSAGGAGGGFPDNGGPGGGVVRLTVGGLLRLDGTINADGSPGMNFSSGGGSGGTVYLTVGGLTGSGMISANGGSGDLPNGGGGGGGVVAISASSNQFTGTLTAHGGAGYMAGGAGTIFVGTKQTTYPGTVTGLLLIDNDGLIGTNTPITFLILPAGTIVDYDLRVANGAVAEPGKGASALGVRDLDLEANGILTQTAGQPGLVLTVSSNAFIGSTAAIAANAEGYGGGSGPGTGSWSKTGQCGGGGGYGGIGGAGAFGAAGGNTYGSSNEPTVFGSGGGFPEPNETLSQGGGAIELKAGGVLIVNGTITANGESAQYPGSGGGSGGSILLTASSLAGTGAIMANGGSGDRELGGGGGGGRIAVYSESNLFSGTLSESGGAGLNAGQEGTLYLSEMIEQKPEIAPVQFLAARLEQGARIIDLNWNGSAASSYQIEFSTNLVEWLPLGTAFSGKDEAMSFSISLDSGVKFFRVVPQSQ